MVIIHALTRQLWDTYSDKENYGQESLDKFGFIHCSDVHTYKLVAPNFKNEKQDMVLLLIDTDKVKSAIVWEDLRNCGVKFPHIYDLLNRDAVVTILPHLWDYDREWIMNEELKDINSN